ncbi:hypothetical protein BDW62DRAFT_204983 [Aspergillus aurantiobrunneus]
MAQVISVCAEARRRYAEVASLEPNDPKFPRPSSVDELFTALETQSQKFTEFRSRKGKFFHLLFEVSKPIAIIGRVSGGAAEAVFPAGPVCLGAAAHLTTSAKDVSQSYDAILDLLDQLKTLLVRLNIYERTTIPAFLQAHFTDILATFLDILAYSTKIISRGIRNRFSRFAKGEDETVSGLVATLDRFSRNEQLLTGVEALATAQGISEKQETIHQDVQGMKEVLLDISSSNHIEDYTNQQHLGKAKDILRPFCLRDMAYQTYQDDPDFREYFDSHFHTEEDVKSPASIWREVFQNYFLRDENARKLYLVFDGLDEAFEEDRETPLPILRPRCKSFYELTMATNESFPTIHHLKVKALARFSKQLKEEIAECLSQKSQGMFLWRGSPASTKGLNDMLQNVLENYSMLFEDQEDAADFNTILAWIACAAEPLYLAELDEILRLRSGADEGISKFEERLRLEWGVLLDLNRDDSLTTADLGSDPTKLYNAMEGIEIDDANDEENEDGAVFFSNPLITEVVFCHASISDFFRDTSTRIKVPAGDGHPEIGVDMAEVAAKSLQGCLQTIRNQPVTATEYSNLRKYALRKWIDHSKLAAKYVGGIDKNSREALGVLLLDLLKDEENMEDWLGEAPAENFNMTTLNSVLIFLKECSTLGSISPEQRKWG